MIAPFEYLPTFDLFIAIRTDQIARMKGFCWMHETLELDQCNEYALKKDKFFGFLQMIEDGIRRWFASPHSSIIFRIQSHHKFNIS